MKRVSRTRTAISGESVEGRKGHKAVFLLAPGQFAGAEGVVLAGAAAARARGMDVEIWLLHEQRQPQHADEFIRRAGRLELLCETLRVHGRFDLSVFVALRNLLQQRGISVLHAHGYKALIYALPMRRYCALVATHHGVTAHTWQVRFYHAIEFFCLRRCQQVFAVSKAMAEVLAKRGIPATRIIVQDNPLTLTLPAARAPQGDGRRLLFIGRLSPEKGLDTLLEALASPATAQWSLSVAGDGPQGPAWQQLAQRLGLGERVHWLGYRKEVAELLLQADAFVLPSLREGLPLALIEATAMGLPALVSQVGATDQLVRQDDNGQLLPAGQVDAWREALAQLAENDAAWQAMRQRAYSGAAEVRRRYSKARWAELLEQAYQGLKVPVA